MREIRPQLNKDKTVLIVAHGNSLRALIMYLENLNEKAIESVEVVTGIPIVYEFSNDMTVIKKSYL